MPIRVMRTQIRELRLQRIQLVIDSRQRKGRGIAGLGWTLHHPVLLQHTLQINALLLGSIQGILFILQLGLQTRQNLQIARQLSRHLSSMLPLELADGFFLARKRFSCSL